MNRLLIGFTLAALTVAASHAQTWRVTPTGTRTSCTNGNGDGSPAQSYGSATAIMNTCAASVAANDVIEFDDGSYPAAITCSPSLAFTGKLTLRSRSGRAAGVVIAEGVAGNAAAISLSCAAGNVDFEFKDLTIRKAAPHTATALAFIMIQNETRDVTFNGTVIEGFYANLTGNNAALSGTMVSRFNGTRTTRTVTFDNATMRNFDYTFQNTAAYVLHAGTGTSVRVLGDTVIEDVLFRSTGSGAGTGNTGGLYIQGSALTVDGALIGRRIQSHTNLAQQNHALVRVNSPATVSFAHGAKIACTDFWYTQDSADSTQAACVEVTGAFDLIRGVIEGTQVRVGTSPGVNNTGGVAVFSSPTAVGAARVKCQDAEAKNGACVYAGNGATIDLRVASFGGRAVTGMVYFGGWNTNKLSGVITGATAMPGAVLSLEVYSQIHASTPTSPKFTYLTNLTLGPRAEKSDLPAIMVTGANVTYSHTASIKNILDLSGAETSLRLAESAGAVLNASIGPGALRSIAETITAGTYSAVDQFTGDTSLSGGTRFSRLEDFIPLRKSPVCGRGEYVGEMLDMTDYPLGNPPPLGGMACRPLSNRIPR